MSGARSNHVSGRQNSRLGAVAHQSAAINADRSRDKASRNAFIAVTVPTAIQMENVGLEMLRRKAMNALSKARNRWANPLLLIGERPVAPVHPIIYDLQQRKNFMKSTTRLAAIAICAAVLGVFLAPSQSAHARNFNAVCSGTSQCTGNLSCHKSLGVGRCVCPTPGDGSYKVSGGQRDCWGTMVPKDRCWKSGGPYTAKKCPKKGF